jgi:hypothetical protein
VTTNGDALSRHADIAVLREFLTPLVGPGALLVEPVDGGWRIVRTEHHFVDVQRMMHNYRITTTPVDVPYIYDRYWCYAGTTPDTFTATIIAAAMFDGELESDPLGWNKNGQTQTWRSPGSPGTFQSVAP